MKLTRDAFGNYSYQYVADENKIADAEAEVKAAENELYNLRKEHEKELIDNFGAYLTDYQTQRAEAIAAKDDALVEALDEKYLGENGLLTNLQSEVLSLGDGTGLFVGQLDTIANMNFDNLKANINSLTSSTKAQLEEITNTINSSIGSGDFVSAATALASTATDLNTLTEDAEKIIGTFSSSVDKLSEVVGKLDSAAKALTTKANAAIGKYGNAVGENAIANNYDIEDIDISLADRDFIDSTGNSDNEETDEGVSTDGINISNFIGAINDKIADYFNSMSESLQNNDITRVLGSATEAIEENTEAIKTLTEELKEDSSTPPVVISGGGASQSPPLEQWANRNIS
jgi:vacuolar-type H+-ATPase subunit I/STV1